MPRPVRTSFSWFLGWSVLGLGSIYAGIGMAYCMRGRGLEGFDGLLLGMLAIGAGLIILHRHRSRLRRSTVSVSTPLEEGAESER